jgi:hypothetical protein
LGVELGGIVAFEHAELKFVGCCRGITDVYAVAVDQLIAPNAGIGERSGNWAADTTRIILDDEFTQCRERCFR